MDFVCLPEAYSITSLSNDLSPFQWDNPARKIAYVVRITISGWWFGS